MTNISDRIQRPSVPKSKILIRFLFISRELREASQKTMYRMTPFCKPAAIQFIEMPSGAEDIASEQISMTLSTVPTSRPLIVCNVSKLP